MIMDLEETEGRNDCAGEGQEELNRPTDEGTLETAVRVVGSWCEMAASLRRRKFGSRGTSTVGRRYQKRLVKSMTGNIVCV
jgi:hypothetical protein